LSWISDFRRILDTQPCVLVTLKLISGSAPRESGSRMIVSKSGIEGSIGGGNLEFQAMERARNLLESNSDGHQEQVLYGLGPALNQCCGGAVSLLFEVFRDQPPHWLEELHTGIESGAPIFLISSVDAVQSCKFVISNSSGWHQSLPAEVAQAAREKMENSLARNEEPIAEIKASGNTWWLERIGEKDRPVMLFGAGHVGQAVAQALAPLPFSLTWVDDRTGVFPPDMPSHIKAVQDADLAKLAARAAPKCIFVVMTHSHQLDEDICFEVLSRGDFSWLGLIGSVTKRRRFVHRLEQRGIAADKLNALVCPIGLSSIRGKQPATIALSLAAQLMIVTPTEMEDS
jgi:xanthine dehydrogenase accessory factor